MKGGKLRVLQLNGQFLLRKTEAKDASGFGDLATAAQREAPLSENCVNQICSTRSEPFMKSSQGMIEPQVEVLSGNM
jgi:hypothetical protein